MKKYKFLLFDADRTLLDFDAELRPAIKLSYINCGLDKIRPYEEKFVEIYEKYNNKWWKIYEGGGCEKETLFVERFKEFLQELKIDFNPKQLNNKYFDALAVGGSAFPGAVDMVRSLSEKYDIYIVTNGYVISAAPRLKNAGLLPYISEVFVSEAAGAPKPEKEYFDYVSENIPGFSKEKALVIGDSLSSDIEGAIRYELDSLWYNPNGNPIPYGIRTQSVSSFDEILSILL